MYCIVRARWLHELEGSDDIYIIDPKYKMESIEIKLIWDTCAGVAMAGWSSTGCGAKYTKQTYIITLHNYLTCLPYYTYCTF